MTEIKTESGLKYIDIKIGDGHSCTGRGQTVLVHYEGWLENGDKFDSSRDRSDAFSFPVTCGYMIPKNATLTFEIELLEISE